MTPEGITKLCKALSVVLFTIGAFGCFACLPYALGPSIGWVTATGVYFIAGGVIMSGGLVSYILLNQQKQC